MDGHRFDPLLSARRQAGASSIGTEQSWLNELPTCLTGRWEDRNPLNVPGPFYGAETDDCMDGPICAPETHACDHDGRGYVWRQPTDDAPVLRTLVGMYLDPFCGFAWDGNDHWTTTLVREWWSARAGRADLIGEPVDYPDAEMAYDLRRYLYFLDTGRYPAAGVLLPDLWS